MIDTGLQAKNDLYATSGVNTRDLLYVAGGVTSNLITLLIPAGGIGAEAKSAEKVLSSSQIGRVELQLEGAGNAATKFGSIPKPVVSDSKLQDIMNQLYRPNASIGNGSTADAIREQLSTGKLVGERDHIIKGQERVVNLTRWIQNNPNASPSDMKAAQDVLNDLQKALNGN